MNKIKDIDIEVAISGIENKNISHVSLAVVDINNKIVYQDSLSLKESSHFLCSSLYFNSIYEKIKT